MPKDFSKAGGSRYIREVIAKSVATKGLTKEQAWSYAIGIVQTEGRKVSDKFLEWVEMEKRGEITRDDMLQMLYEKAKTSANQQ